MGVPTGPTLFHTLHFRALIKQDIAVRSRSGWRVEEFGLNNAPCGLGQLAQGLAGKRELFKRPNRMSFKKRPLL